MNYSTRAAFYIGLSASILNGAGAVWAHGTETHSDSEISISVPASTSTSIPINVGGTFELIDHNGNLVTDQSYNGKHMLVYFGYASCKIMCSVTLSRIGDALEILDQDLEKLNPVVVTVDPERDTPLVLRTELAKYHQALIGLTGSTDQLATVYKAYKQAPTLVDGNWNGDPVVSHSSYIYLMGPQGQFQTLFPPILSAQSMANIVRKYLN